MRNKSFKKNIFLKKSTWLLIVVFIATLITIPSFTTKVQAREQIYSTVIKILNIDPGANSFTIGDGTERVYNTTSDGSAIEVTRITMAEFNSMVDEIKGKYDIVVVGRSNTGLIKDFDYEKQYRDYSEPFYQEFTYLSIGGIRLTNKDPNEIRNKLKYYSANPVSVPIGGDIVLKKNPYYSGYLFNFKGADNGKTFIEYYSENDITKKRAKQLQAMADGGELVYFANEIFNDSQLNTSNLYTLFNSNNKVKKASQSELTNLDNIILEYKKVTTPKKPNVTRLEMSSDDSDTNLEFGNLSSRTMEYTLTIPGIVPENYMATISLDINADGIFNEKERPINLKGCLVSGTTDKYKITNVMDNAFVGYLDWKIEITNNTSGINNGLKTYVTNSTIFKPMMSSQRKILNVLQILPDSKNNLILKDDTEFTKFAKSAEILKLGYEINFTSIKCSELNTKLAVAANANYLNDFNMLIVGFGDSYGNGQLGTNAVDKIEAFIKSGEATMLTHDTITLNTFGSTDANWDMGVGPKLLGQRLRDYVGQSRYIDNYRNGSETDLNGKDTIYHDTLDGATVYKNTSKKWSMGGTLYMNQFTSTYSTNVRNINKSQITNYPYSLAETIPVAQTHTQWFQLNLEDEEVVPWFNIIQNPTSNTDIRGTKFDSGDSRNFYYTYSRKNITYSGTGHSSAYPKEEYQLFVNTIIKAARGAEHPPEIINKTISNDTVILDKTKVTPLIKNTEDFTFKSIIDDQDEDLMKVTVTAGGQPIITDTEFNRYSNDIIEVKIPKEIYITKVTGSFVEVVTTVTDATGRIGSKSFQLEIQREGANITHNVLVGTTETNNTNFTGVGTASYVGRISSIFNPYAQVTLDMDTKLIVNGDVLITRVDKDDKPIAGSSWKMIKDATSGLYTYTLKPSDIANVGIDGIRLRVEYNVIIKTLSMTDKVLYNNILSTENENKTVTIYNEITAPDLF